MRFSLVFAVKTVGLVFILVTVANLLLCEWGLKHNNGEIAFKENKSYTVRQATKLPPHIAELFPAHINTTDISHSSLYHNFHGSSIRQESSEKKRDIFQILARWDNLSADFLPSHIPHNKVLTGYEWRKTSPYEKVCSDGEVVNGSVWCKRPAECYLEERTRNTTHDTQSVGDHILFTVRTTSSLHSQRLPLILQTWLSTVNPSNVVLVTDGHDSVLKYRAHEAGITTVVSVPGYNRLCEKAGDELSLLFLTAMQHYQWLCHVDDDMYVNLKELAHILNIFDDSEPVYFGRSGTFPDTPRAVLKESLVGMSGELYDFAVGGMYCLNRPMLTKSRR